MKVYAILEDVGSEYETLAPVEISMTPFKENCYFVDLVENQTYVTIITENQEDFGIWEPYNCEKPIGEYFCNPTTGEYINSKIIDWDFDGEIELENGEIINFTDPKYVDWELEWILFQKYENGLPVGKPYFKFN